MRVLKNNIYNSIIESARNEFILKGYKDASMRIIAKNANVGLSNIYNYFKNKDEIFQTIVLPAKIKLFNFITKNHTEEGVDFTNQSYIDYNEEMINCYIELIYKYKEEYYMLLYHSQGSSMCDFRTELTSHMTQVSFTYMKLIKKYYPKANQVSDFFFHAISSWMTTILGEIVTHDVSRKKVREFFDEYFRYGYAGWCELTGIKKETN